MSAVVTCPSWCRGKHDPKDGTPGYCVVHDAPEVTFTGISGQVYTLRHLLVERTEDPAQSGELIEVDSPSGALRREDVAGLASFIQDLP